MSEVTNEVMRKLNSLRKILAENDGGAFHFRGVDWFSWITGGGSSVVILTAEVGVAEVLVTKDEAWILTNRIESERLFDEEVSSEFQMTAFPWQESNAVQNFVKEKSQTQTIFSDRPSEGEKNLPYSVLLLKMKMQREEIRRYRELGRSAAEAMTDALITAQPDWTEHQLAAAGAQALSARGLDPTLILVAGSERCKKYRHPIPKHQALGESAMMVFCARGFGMYANLTRFIFFRDLNSEEQANYDQLLDIESAALYATTPGNSLSFIYQELADNYAAKNKSEQIHLHHQGGPTGYLSREFVARPQESSPASQLTVEMGMAFAWNPSLPGLKVEDTVLVNPEGLEILTCDPRWPTRQVGNYLRPDIWIKK